MLNMVLFNPEQPQVLSAASHHSTIDYTPYEGRTVIGKVEKVFLRGDLIVDGDQWLGSRGQGRFQKRGASGRCM